MLREQKPGTLIYLINVLEGTDTEELNDQKENASICF